MTTPYGILIRGAQFQTPTATGNVTHAVNLEGLTPKAAMLYFNFHNPADGAVHTNHAQVCLGVTDGTNHRYAGASSENNVNPTNDFSFQGNNHVLLQVNPNTGATLIAADFVSFTADSITLNYTAVDVVAHEGILILFTGNDLSAFVGDTGSLGNAAGTHTVAAPFRVDSLFMFGSHAAVSAIDATINKFAFIFGIYPGAASGDGPSSHMIVEPDGQSAGSGAAGRPQSIPGFHTLTVVDPIATGAIHADISNILAASFDVVVDGAMANAAFPFLALHIGDWWTVNYQSWDSSTVIAVVPWIGGFVQQAFIALSTSHDTTFGSLNDTSLSGGIGIGFMGNDGQQWSGMTQIDNTGQNVTKTKSLLRNLGYFVASADADAIVEGSINLLTDPTNIHFTTVTPTSRRTYFWGMHFPEVLPAFLDEGTTFFTPLVVFGSTAVDIGGTNFMLDSDGFDIKLLPHILAKTHTGSELEIGPFRYPKQEHADETSTVDSLIVDVSESKNGEPVITNDWLEEDEDDFDEDWNDSPLPEDDTDDWGLIPGLPDLFDTELMSTDDGMSPQFQGVEILTAVEEFNASRKYEPVGFSAIMHRLKFKTSAVGHKFYIKVIDIAGLLTGRHK